MEPFKHCIDKFCKVC